MRKITSLIPVLAMVAGALVGGLGGGTPAQATNCYWFDGRFGDSSNCDNVEEAACGNWRTVRSKTIGSGILVELRYSSECRSVAAHISAQIGDLLADNCYVKVQRNSDNEILRAGVVHESRNPNFYYGITRMLYDADVTSYAWGYCKLSNGAVYSGGTSSY